jgi:hypothetical protein
MQSAEDELQLAISNAIHIPAQQSIVGRVEKDSLRKVFSTGDISVRRRRMPWATSTTCIQLTIFCLFSQQASRQNGRSRLLGFFFEIANASQ